MDSSLLIIGLLLTAMAIGAAEMRTWTFEATGKTIQGEVAGFTGGTVTLKGTDGKTFSVPVQYLTDANRAFLATERAKQWKEVEVVKLEGDESAKRYKKCTVRGQGVGGEILIQLLPTTAEVVLNARNQQAAQIAALSEQIKHEDQAVKQAKASIPTTTPAYAPNRQAVRLERAQVNTAAKDLKNARTNLANLLKSYDAYVEKTRKQTTVKMRNTGTLYKKLAVWECFNPRKPQQ